MSAVTSVGYELSLQKTINGSPEEVFDAWLDIEILRHWFGPGDEMNVEVKLLEPHVGGKFQAERWTIQLTGSELRRRAAASRRCR